MDMRKYLQTITPCLNTHDKEQEIPSLIPPDPILATFLFKVL